VPSARSATLAPAAWRRIAAIGKPRIARACSANSLHICVAIVTMPVSCGRGLTSLNITLSSFRRNSSTPKIP
jgi:hypothetical protein